MPGWDYPGNGYYFITLVTPNRECNPGKIINGKIILSDFGRIVDPEWNKSFEICYELILDKYFIMPNHLHAIVIIDKLNIDDDLKISHDLYDLHDLHGFARRDARPCVSTIQFQFQCQSFYRKPKS